MTRCYILVGLVLAGCTSITEVDAPDVVEPDDYTTAAGASALAVGGITRFYDVFGGVNSSAGNVVSRSGQLADELTVTAINVDIGWDSRSPLEPPLDGGSHYTSLHRARINLLTAIAALQRTAPDSAARIGQLFALVGYTETFLGESYCAGVPLSGLDAEFRPVYGQPLTLEEMHDRARADFDSALAYGADSARIAFLAAVGKGRALLNMGRSAEAGEAVAGVPTSYLYHAIYVTGTLNNGIYGLSDGDRSALTVPDREGMNGVGWRSAADPRVPLVNRSPDVVGRDGSTEVWAFVPYQSGDARIPLASGVEARLIEAEAALQGGDVGTWLMIHNTLRATVPELDPLADPGTPADRVDLHFRERAFWLFLTGHRHGDLRRLVRQYGRDSETVFPTGEWQPGIPYGTAMNVAIPAQESPNPNYVGCLDREA